MTTKEFSPLSTSVSQDPPHRGISRAPVRHGVRLAVAGAICVVGVFLVLWALYTFG